QNVTLPKPKAGAKSETYSVVVNNVKADDLLFALARDAKLNVDIHPGITGLISLNAIDQTLPQLLSRIAKQADIRFELEGGNLVVMPDTPYLHNYVVDYLNMERDTSGSVAITTQVASGAPSSGTSSAGGGSTGGSGANNSLTRIDNKSQNHFWAKLEQNIKDLLRETDKVLPDGSSETVVEQANTQSTTGTGANPANNARGGQNAASLASSPNPASLQNSGSTVVRRTTFREAASVIVNAEAGVISIRATGRQHEKIQQFLDQIMLTIKRQVLIEATVAEVSLSDEFQQGVDWSVIPLGKAGFTIKQTAAVDANAPATLLSLGYKNTASGNFTSEIKLLEAFGTVKILSSPKLSVMNNQTAVLKVVDNKVFFTVKADTTATANTSTTTFTTTLQSVPVGFVMNVTPQINEADTVMLNIRPSISSIVDFVSDPNPSLKNPCGFGVSSCSIQPIDSKIPVVRTREMESVIRVENGNIAVMGGLIEERIESQDNGVPGVSGIPLFGNLFKQRREQSRKTELVVFLRPIVLKDASLDGDFRSLRSLVPKSDFLSNKVDRTQRSLTGFSGAGSEKAGKSNEVGSVMP
ncbi:MAG: secretin N-terminal domain-containing protein, partial [Pseudomonadota bacterium]